MSAKTTDRASVRQVFATNLNRFMKAQNISRRKLSTDLEIKYTTLCDWVKGNSTPKPEAVEKISNYLGVSVADFYIDYEQSTDSFTRLLNYAGGGMVMEMDILKSLNDEQIKELLKKGFTFRHKTLEERAKEAGGLALDGEFDFGKPVGREVW